MKSRREHRVPLPPRAVDIVRNLYGERKSEFVFPGAKDGQPLSSTSMLKLLELMGRETTTHGFRSCFRDWAAETTDYPNHVVEMALAHTISSKVEAAYRRGDLFEKRRKLMDSWAAFCAKPASDANVLPLRGVS